MQIKLLFFASYQDIAGSPEMTVDLADGATAADCAAWLTERYPGFAAVLPHGRIAVNLDMAEPSTPLTDGDTVAFMPPMSGG